MPWIPSSELTPEQKAKRKANYKPAGPKKKHREKIFELLDAGWSVAHIAQAIGRTEALVIRARKEWRAARGIQC